MLQYLVMFLIAATTSVFGTNTQGLIAGDVSPAPKAAVSADEDTDDTGEVDDDIIIDEENTDDDEDVQN